MGHSENSSLNHLFNKRHTRSNLASWAGGTPVVQFRGFAIRHHFHQNGHDDRCCGVNFCWLIVQSRIAHLETLIELVSLFILLYFMDAHAFLLFLAVSRRIWLQHLLKKKNTHSQHNTGSAGGKHTHTPRQAHRGWSVRSHCSLLARQLAAQSARARHTPSVGLRPAMTNARGCVQPLDTVRGVLNATCPSLLSHLHNR